MLAFTDEQLVTIQTIAVPLPRDGELHRARGEGTGHGRSSDEWPVNLALVTSATVTCTA